jgi:twitching motility protein PilT
LPPIVQTLAQHKQGLVLVTGATGTGKSTTLAALIDQINKSTRLNIITLEDPIEFIHPSKQSQVIQREVGTHVRSFFDGLRAALREDPDVILVGEMRDPETISMAMLAAETGHLVLGTLHTTSATKSLDRVLDALPAEQREQGKIFLARNLHAVVTQVLVKSPDGRGRKAVVEIMLNTHAIANLILSDKTFQIPSQIQTGRDKGMQLMDQALMDALQRKEIDPNDAYLYALDKKLFQRHVTDAALVPKFSLAGS